MQEHLGGSAGFAARRRPLRVSPVDLRYPRGAKPCTRGRVGWMAFDGFTDAGRNFYVFAAVGTRVSAPTRRELQRVVDSLRFEPRRRRAAESP